MSTKTTKTASAPVAPVAVVKEAPRGTKAEMLRKHLAAMPDAALKDIAAAVEADAKSQNFAITCSVGDVSAARHNNKPKTEKKAAEPTLADGLRTLEVIQALGGMAATAQLLKSAATLMAKTADIAKFRELFISVAKLQGSAAVELLEEPVAVEAVAEVVS